MTTKTADQTTTLDELDFQPGCRIHHRQQGGKRVRCENPAAWVGYAPCCGDVALVCESHFHMRHKAKWVCVRCPRPTSVHEDLIGWHRL